MLAHKRLPKLDLNITNRCNFRCVHCAFDSGIAKMNELSLKELKKLFVETKELGGEKIDITGGEPTLRKDICKIIALGKSLGYKIELNTNGSLATRRQLLEFKKAGLDSIAISLDGSTYEIYRKIRKVSIKIYNKVLKTIKACVELGFYTKVNSVAFASNINDIPKITDFCIKNKIKEHGIYYFTPIGRGSSANELSIEPIVWINFIRKNLIRYAEKIKISIEFPLIEKTFAKETGCIFEDDPFHLQILPNGNVYPCAILSSYNQPIANLHKTSIKKIWNNKRLWEDYCKKIHHFFNKFNNSCISFSNFEIRRYAAKYKFVCPLRKFLVEELK